MCIKENKINRLVYLLNTLKHALNELMFTIKLTIHIVRWPSFNID
jgi:hypothetical protein